MLSYGQNFFRGQESDGPDGFFTRLLLRLYCGVSNSSASLILAHQSTHRPRHWPRRAWVAQEAPLQDHYQPGVWGRQDGVQARVLPCQGAINRHRHQDLERHM